MIRKRICSLVKESRIAGIAWFVLFACACCDDGSMPDSGGSGMPVSFTASESNTRVSQITTTANIDNMALFAYSAKGNFNAATSTPDYMYNKAVNKANGVWTYAPAMYWLDAPYTFSFFAVHPIPSAANGIELLTAAETPGYPTFRVTPAVSPSQQVDLCMATPVLNATYIDPDGDGNSTNDMDGNVPLNFKHATAKINFKARYTGGDVNAWIDAIELVGVIGSGKLEFTQDAYIWTPDVNSTVNYELALLNGELSYTPILKSGATGDDAVSSVSGTLCIVPQTIPAGAQLNVRIRTGGLIGGAEGVDIATYSYSKQLSSGIWSAEKSHDFNFTINDLNTKLGNLDFPVGKTWDITYTGGSQVFTAPVNGKYKMEIWGNQGGRTGYWGGKGGYTAGDIELTAGDLFKIYVGQCDYSHNYVEGWNGGGKAGGYNFCSPGGGSIDVRLLHFVSERGFSVLDTATDDNPFIGLTGNEDTDPRIIVGGGGGGMGSNDNGYHWFSYGGYAGGSAGGSSIDADSGFENGGKGGTQTAGGISDRGNYGYTIGLTDGSAGRGGNTGKKNNGDSSSSGGGGGGWFGGGCGSWYKSTKGTGGGGGSSHVNSQLFTNTVCKAGNEEFLSPMGIAETGHSGPGLVRITLLEVY